PMGARICVLGWINVDGVVRVAGFPAGGETVAGLSCDLVPGGKGANQAVAAANMGVPVDLIGALGSDEFGRLLRAYLSDSGVNIDAVGHADGPSGTAVVTVDAGGQNQIVVVPGANERIPRAAVESYLPRGAALRYLVSQFEVSTDLVPSGFAGAKACGAT